MSIFMTVFFCESVHILGEFHKVSSAQVRFYLHILRPVCLHGPWQTCRMRFALSSKQDYLNAQRETFNPYFLIRNYLLLKVIFAHTCMQNKLVN